MTALGLALIVVALALLLAEAHLSTGGLMAACASLAAVGGVVLLLLAAGAGGVVVLVVGLCAAAGAVSLLLLARRQSCCLCGRILAPGERRSWDTWAWFAPMADQAGGVPRRSLWRAEPSPIHHESELHDGDRVVVESVNGLTLRVRKAEQWELNP